MFKFCRVENLEDWLLNEQLGSELLIDHSDPNVLVFFSNGDKMTVHISERIMEWEPISPGSLSTSRLSMRLHQWYGKGIIKEIKEEK